MSARSRRALANLEKRIQKFIDTAFFWPVEVGKILMRLLIVILNKLVRIISRRNRLVSKIALGDHLVGWSSIRGSIFRRIGYDQGGYSLFLTRARARGVRGYFWDSGSFRRRAGCGRRFCDFRKRFIFARIEKVSIPLYAGGRPVLRNICKIAKFVDTAENEPKEVFLIWKCFIFRIHCLAVYGPAIFLFSHKAGLVYMHPFTPSSTHSNQRLCPGHNCPGHNRWFVLCTHEHHLNEPWKTTSLEGVKWCI